MAIITAKSIALDSQKLNRLEYFKENLEYELFWSNSIIKNNASGIIPIYSNQNYDRLYPSFDFEVGSEPPYFLNGSGTVQLVQKHNIF